MVSGTVEIDVIEVIALGEFWNDHSLLQSQSFVKQLMSLISNLVDTFDQ